MVLGWQIPSTMNLLKQIVLLMTHYQIILAIHTSTKLATSRFLLSLFKLVL